MKRNAFQVMWLLALVMALSFGILVPGAVGSARAQEAQQPVPYRLSEVVSGLSRPIYVTHAGDGSGRLFIVEQGGLIKVLAEGALLGEPFLDVTGLISAEALGGGYTERGLLGLAFHPNYAENGLFFINYTDRTGSTVVARYRVSAEDPNRADPASEEQLLYVSQPYANHNGGHMAFGTDGYLYISLGDGGSGGDPQGHGQNLRTLLGAILRLDVDVEEGYAIPADNPFVGSEDARPEIWAWGVRNVWRFSFDRQTGDLLMADVGQNEWEEINFQSAGSPGGQNYGWNAYEATHRYPGANPTADMVMPVLEYRHDNAWCSVTGGYVYRGAALPGLQGYYLYGDWCTGTIWAARPDAAGVWSSTILLETRRQISSFGEDEAGELYVVDYAGAVLRLEP